MFTKSKEHGYHRIAEGIELKTLTHGTKTLTVQFRLAAGHDLPRHSHPYEQAGYLVSGRIILTVGAETFEAAAGDSWCIPEGVEHGAQVVENSIAVEVFSPLREDYLQYVQGGGDGSS